MAGATLYTVIVADDEDELRGAVCTMIPWEELGFRLAGSAGNGLDALQLVEKLEPDLLLTDRKRHEHDCGYRSQHGRGSH